MSSESYMTAEELARKAAWDAEAREWTRRASEVQEKVRALEAEAASRAPVGEDPLYAQGDAYHVCERWLKEQGLGEGAVRADGISHRTGQRSFIVFLRTQEDVSVAVREIGMLLPLLRADERYVRHDTWVGPKEKGFRVMARDAGQLGLWSVATADEGTTWAVFKFAWGRVRDEHTRTFDGLANALAWLYANVCRESEGDDD